MQRKTPVGSRPSASKLPVRSSALFVETPSAKRESRPASRGYGDIRKSNASSRASSTGRASVRMSVERPSAAFQRSRSSASLRTPQRLLQAPGSASRAKSSERSKRVMKKDCRPIHDKKWQAEQVAKSQAYFQDIPEARKLLNNGISFRPMTLNMFVQLSNIVLHNIDPTFPELTLANYVEKLPNLLNILMYPAQVSVSTLKTANTMHSWAHILGVLSWLAAVHQLMHAHIFQQQVFHIEPHMTDEQVFNKLKWKAVIDTFPLWNNLQNEEVLLVEVEFRTNLEQYFGVSKEAEVEMQAEIDKVKQDLHTQQKACEKQDQEIQILRDLIERDKMCINDYQTKIDTGNTIYKKNATTIVKTKESIENMKKQLEALKEECAVIKKRVLNQPVSRKQRQELLKEIEDLRSRDALRQNFRQQEKQVHVEKRLKTDQMQREMEKKVSDFNIQLMKLYSQSECTGLKEFRIEHENFFPDDENVRKFSRELEKKSQNIETFKKSTKETIKKLEAQTHELNLKKAQMKKDRDDLIKKNKNVMLLKEKLKSKQMEIEKERTPLVENLERLNKEEAEMLERKKILAEKNERLKLQIQQEQEEGLHFFREIKKEIGDVTLPAVDEIMSSVNHDVETILDILQNPPKENDTGRN